MSDTLVDQTILAADPSRPGNCVAACVASYLGCPLEEVPHFLEIGEAINGKDDAVGWWMLLVGFMAGRGLWPLQLNEVTDPEPGEISFVMGMSARGVRHQVLYRDGALYHDPHPSRVGVIDIREVLVWRPHSHDHTPTTGANA